MKLRILAVLAVLALGTVASAQSYEFGFLDASCNTLCDYEQFSYAGGDLYAGIHNVSVCGSSNNSTILGFGAGNPNKGKAALTAGVVFGDNIYDAYSQSYTGVQWTYWSALKCNKQVKGRCMGKFGWIGVAAMSGFFLGGNQGYLSCSIPRKGDGEALMHGPSISKLPTEKK